jgi:hypothetical protein
MAQDDSKYTKLCKECNRALGLFGDNIDTLTNSVLYLKERGSYGRKQNQVH